MNANGLNMLVFARISIRFLGALFFLLLFVPYAEASEVYCSLNDGIKADGQTAMEHQGKKHHFCCAGCLEQFKADPEKFATQMSHSSPANSQEAEAACSSVCSE